MNSAIRISPVLLLIVLLTIATLCFGSTTTQSPKKRLQIVPFLSSQLSCHPAEVTASSMGAKPPEVLMSAVVVESFSPKPITALKVTWMIFAMDEGLRIRRQPCDALGDAKVLLSGTTPLIQVGQLSEKEVCLITIGVPVVNAPRATKAVAIDRPIIAWDEVKSLTLDGTRESLRDNYAGVVFVSELHFEDGTVWTRQNMKAETAAQQIGPEPREACFALSMIRRSCSVAPWPGQLLGARLF